jgi:hypothetical protein
MGRCGAAGCGGGGAGSGIGILRVSKQVSTRFFEKKRGKKLLLLGALSPLVPAPAGAKVFCFFFSKKKRFL